MRKLVDLIDEYKDGKISLEELHYKATFYDDLFDQAKFVCAIGSPIKSSKDFQRAQKEALGAVGRVLLCIENEISPYGLSGLRSSEFYFADIEEAKGTAKKYGIRPVWLNSVLD